MNLLCANSMRICSNALTLLSMTSAKLDFLVFSDMGDKPIRFRVGRWRTHITFRKELGILPVIVLWPERHRSNWLTRTLLRYPWQKLAKLIKLKAPLDLGKMNSFIHWIFGIKQTNNNC